MALLLSSHMTRKGTLLDCVLLLNHSIRPKRFNQHLRDCIFQKVTCSLFISESDALTAYFGLHECDAEWFRREQRYCSALYIKNTNNRNVASVMLAPLAPLNIEVTLSRHLISDPCINGLSAPALWARPVLINQYYQIDTRQQSSHLNIYVCVCMCVYI